MDCGFVVDIHAPEGLAGIQSKLAECAFPVRAHRSGYNGKIILRCDMDGVEWDMDSSDDAGLFASGAIDGTFAHAEALLRSLSGCLVKAGFPHRILIEDTVIEHLWLPEYEPSD
jgi:hypothetical protein